MLVTMTMMMTMRSRIINNYNDDADKNDKNDNDVDRTFRHCQSCRRSCSRWKRRPAAFSTKTKRCRGWVGQDDDDDDGDDDGYYDDNDDAAPGCALGAMSNGQGRHHYLRILKQQNQRQPQLQPKDQHQPQPQHQHQHQQIEEKNIAICFLF